MAARDPARRHLSTTTLSCLATLVCLASLLFLFSFRSSLDRQPSRSPPRFLDRLRDPSERWWRAPCNYYDGAWVWDPYSVAPRYDKTCKEIFKGWNCFANHKSNGPDLLRWRWKPSSCDLPRIDPLRFLERYRNISIGFVGDSLNRNMFASLVCMLRRASNQVKKWRPAGADRGFTFLSYNLTVAYHRTNLLVRYGRWSASFNASALESLGYKQGYRVDVDVPDQTWSEAPHFHDILIFNTGHWWLAPSKFDPVQSPMLFFEKGLPVLPPISPEVLYVERIGIDAVKFFRTQSPRHFEDGDWNKGGSCRRIQPLLPGQVENLFSIENNGTNVEARLINQHLHKVLNGSSFHILDITHMSEFRADAHPSTTGGKKHEDCMHWCLPGLTDTWNDLLVAHIEDLRRDL